MSGIMIGLIVVATFGFLFYFGYRLTGMLDHFLDDSGSHRDDTSAKEIEIDVPADAIYLAHHVS